MSLTEAQSEAVGRIVQAEEQAIMDSQKKIGVLRDWERQQQCDEKPAFSMRNNGADVTLYSCSYCGATVLPQDQGIHIEWDRELRRLMRRHRIGDL